MNYHCCVSCHFPLLSTCSLAFLLALSWFPTIAFMQSLWLFEWYDITWFCTHSGPLLFLFVDYVIPWDAIGSNYHMSLALKIYLVSFFTVLSYEYLTFWYDFLKKTQKQRVVAKGKWNLVWWYTFECIKILWNLECIIC